jgi:hypothetical protein
MVKMNGEIWIALMGCEGEQMLRQKMPSQHRNIVSLRSLDGKSQSEEAKDVFLRA